MTTLDMQASPPFFASGSSTTSSKRVSQHAPCHKPLSPSVVLDRMITLLEQERSVITQSLSDRFATKRYSPTVLLCAFHDWNHLAAEELGVLERCVTSDFADVGWIVTDCRADCYVHQLDSRTLLVNGEVHDLWKGKGEYLRVSISLTWPTGFLSFAVAGARSLVSGKEKEREREREREREMETVETQVFRTEGLIKGNASSDLSAMPSRRMSGIF
ncbi:hypothetical protein HKX48_005511 [Thoreauomyces humboldtii]|nr:hypothetical protein HKX48_005511 [Thoreauomyces humboldtii]